MKTQINTFKLVAVLAILCVASSTKAQYYLHSAGMRFGPTTALTYKSFVQEDGAIELMLSGRTNGIQLTGLFEKYASTELELRGSFFTYWGVGGHLGYERYWDVRNFGDMNGFFNGLENTFFAMGVDAIAGIEYRSVTLPLTLNLDVKPYLNFVGFRAVNAKIHDIAFSVKYTF